MTDSKRLDRRCEDLLESYIAYQDNTEPPDIYKRWAGISMIAAAMQRKCFLKWGLYKFYPNMYIILVGPPGKARKGTAMRPAKMHLANLRIKTSAEATTKEALIRRIGESGLTITKPNGNPEVHSSLTIFSDELTVFLGYNNKELMANLADWFDCADRWTYDTKGQGTDEIINLWVNILGATTPELMQATMPMELMGGGLSSRMIFVYAPRKGKRAVFPGLTPEQEQMRKDVEHDLESILQMQGDFKVTDNFISRWSHWYSTKPENCPLKSRHLAYYWERREVHLLKLCMIMSASRSNEMVIRSRDFDRADHYLSEVESLMHNAFQGMGHRDDAQVVSLILGEIAERGNCTLSQLLSQFQYDATREQIIELLQLLEMRKMVRINKGMKKNSDWKITYHREAD